MIVGTTADFGCSAAQKWADAWKSVHDDQNSWQSILAGIVGTVGIIQQFTLNQRMVDLAERGVDIAEAQYELTERNYEEIALASFQRSSAYYDDCILEMKAYLRTMLECGLGADALEDPDDVDYDLERGRAEMQVASIFSTTRRNINSRYGKNRVGAICNQNLRVDTLEALARVDATDKAFRYADAKKERLEDRQFDRKLRTAQLAYQISTLAMNGLFQGVSGTASALNATGNGVRGVLAAQDNLSGAFQNLGNFWASLANGAFQFVGFQQGGSTTAAAFNPFGGGAGGAFSSAASAASGLLGQGPSYGGGYGTPYAGVNSYSTWASGFASGTQQ